MKIDNEIITSHDVEKEINYLKALNPRLNQIDKNESEKYSVKNSQNKIINNSSSLPQLIKKITWKK